jgi:restriction system protein
MAIAAKHMILADLFQLWWLWALVATLFVLRAASWLHGQRRLRRSGIGEIDAMTGATFERRLALLFRGLGYSVRTVGKRGDYGADLVIERDGVRTIVQAKRWTRNVGVKAVQEAHAAPAIYGCTRALVVTNRYFTASAQRLARANHVDLWDRDRLVSALLSVAK